MVVREIVVVKKPRDDTLQDKPISFPNLDNLHLDMMENKKKLKKNLPLLVVKPPAAPDSSGSTKKAAIYSPAIISGTAGAAAGAAIAAVVDEVKSAKKKKEKFKGKKSSSKKEVKSEEPVHEADDEGELLDNLGADEEAAEDEAGGLHDGDVAEEDAVEGGVDEGKSVGDEKAEEGHADGEEEDEYAGMSPEERERHEKEEYIWRFKILKKKYKNRKDIPDYNEHDDIITMKQTYERTLREIQLEDNYESYRMYLIGGFMLMEFVSNNWMGVDLTGFTAHQMTMMHKYDRMLIELGEKSYNRWGSNLPVEIRLIGFIILQAGIFYLGKIIADKGGGALTDIFKMFTGASAPPTPASQTAGSGNADVSDVPEGAPKKKMRGPSVKVADLKKRVET